MISDPEPIIQQQNANTDPYSIRGERAFKQPMLQRSMPPWMQRQALPPAQPPMPRPQMGMASGAGMGGGGMPQWAPPWMTGNWGAPQGMGAMGGGMYGGNGGGGVYNDPGFGGGYSPPPQQNFGGYGPPGGMMQSSMGSGYYGQGMQPQSYGGPYGPPGYQQQQQQYRAPNGNTGFAGPMTNQAAPQYSRQSYQPQPAGTVNQASSAPPPQPQQQQQQNRQAAITPTPIFRNTGNDLA